VSDQGDMPIRGQLFQ